MLGRSALPLAVLISSLAILACAESAEERSHETPVTTGGPTDTLIDVGGHRLHVRLVGEGSPTVVIDVGFGGSFHEWDSLVDRLSSGSRVCVYDRAGYGRSEPGPLPRKAGRVVSELLALLDNAGVEPPYVLVGHSLGGLNALLLASRHPDLLAGLVLLDPPPLEFITGRRFPNLREMADEETRKLERAAEAAREGGDEARASFFEILASEHDMMFSESAEEVKAVNDLGALPLAVVGSGVPNPMFGDSAEAFQEFWIESNRRLASISRRGRFVLAPESSHRLHEEASDLVLRVIEETVKARE